MKKDDLVSWLDIFVTERCNLNCKYCFHSQTPRDMSDGVMEATLDFFSDKITDDCIFNLFGGEPTLREDFCIKWVRKILGRFPGARFSISTNAVMFPEKLIEEFKKKYFDVQISYDGVWQDELRGKNDIVVKNINRYIQELTPKNLHFRLTYTQDAVDSLLDSIKLIYSMGGRRIGHQAALNGEWTEYGFKKYKEQLASIYEYIDGVGDLDIYFCKCERVSNSKNSICSMGKGLLAVDAVGDIYPCHRSIKFKEFRIGSVYDEKLNRGRFKNLIMSECNNCFARPTCHPCVIANYELSGSLVENPQATCVINKIEYSEAFERFKAQNSDLFELENILIPMEKVLIDLKEDGEIVLNTLRRIKNAT